MNSFDGRNYVCIVGCPRSGTTWLQKQLAVHPQVITGQETHLFDVYIGPLIRSFRRACAQRRAVGLPGYFVDEAFINAVSSFLQTMLQPMLGSLVAGSIFLDKTPCHILYVSEIVELLPRTRFIHLLRDPRDVVASLLNAAHSWSPRWEIAKTLPSAVHMWHERVERARRIQQRLPSSQFYQIRYEDLHAEPIVSLRNCFEFLGLGVSDEILHEAVSRNQLDELKEGRGTPIPLYGAAARQEGNTVREPPGFFRRGEIGAWKKDLNLPQKLYLWHTVRKLMTRLGYQW